MAKDITIELANGSIPARAYPTMRFHRVDGTVDIYINGTKVVVLYVDEWEHIVRAVS